MRRLRRRQGRRAARLAVLVACLLAAWSGSALAGPEDELAERYAPEVRLVEQTEDCGDGEPYWPTDIDLILPNEEVALRGPWDRTNVVQVGPSAADLGGGKVGYHLDFPGNALDPGCTYEEWSKRITAGTDPTTYARVVTEPGKPGTLALQYWFFYVFNDFNNKHEGDWEMIQLVFDANDAAEALETEPTEVGYSQHEGAERAAWGDEKLTLVDGTHPVVYPAEGSHANHFKEALFLGRSGAEGVGCDDTEGPSTAIRPAVAVVPTDPDAYLESYPWLGFEGRWGEMQPAFYNGPTGPNTKTQWVAPISWSEESWRDEAFAVPGSTSLMGTTATEFFCTAVAAGSDMLTRMTQNPWPTVIALGILAVVLLWAGSRTEWRPSPPLRIAHRRRWGEVVTATWAMYRRHFLLFVRIGVVFLPLAVVVAAIQYVLFRIGTFEALADRAGESNPAVAILAFTLGLVFTFIGLTLVQAAVAHVMREIDAGRPGSALDAYRQAFTHLRALAGGLLFMVVVLTILNLTLVGIPIATWLLVRWSLLAQVIHLEDRPARDALRRSAGLVTGNWWKVASITVFVTGTAVIVGPFLGALMLLVSSASFDVVNLVAGLVYTITLPLASIATTYVYCDLRVRDEQRTTTTHTAPALPAETTLA